MKNRKHPAVLVILFALVVGLGPAGCGDDDGIEVAGPAWYDPTWAVSTDVLEPVRDYQIIRGIIQESLKFFNGFISNF